MLWGVIKKEYRYVKIGFDLAMVVLGTVLGGKLGVVTVVTALAVGPIIQIFMGVLKQFGSASGDASSCSLSSWGSEILREVGYNQNIK